MQNFTYYTPPEWFFGREKWSESGSCCAEGTRKVLIHYGGRCAAAPVCWSAWSER